MSPKQKRTDTVAPLLEFWEHRDEYGRPVGCIATTYTFDAGFFEEECLTRFAGIESDPTEELVAYVVEREEKLAETFACVFVDQGHVPAQRSLRWELLPVRVPGGGIQHAKVTLLAWEQRIRVLVSSGNLTTFGCRRNFENVGVLDFTPVGDTPLIILDEVLAFIELLARLSPGAAGEATQGPQLEVAWFLQGLRARTATWEKLDWERGEPRASFVALSPESRSLFSQIREDVWSGTLPDSAWVLSPFFDQGDAVKRPVEALVDIMGRRSKDVYFIGTGRKHPDGVVELDMPQALRIEWLYQVEHGFALVNDRDAAGNIRTLHAKSLWLEREDAAAVYMIGSSNFTCAGTGVGPTKNIEANLAYFLPPGWGAFHEHCNESYPPHEEIELSDAVQFMQKPMEETPDPEAFMPLPTAFGEALFQPSASGGTLILNINSSAPETFMVRAEEGDTIVDGMQWRARGMPSPLSAPWAHARPPSSLKVSWADTAGGTHVSLWIINVTDRSLLPPPAELRDLPLEVLLEILSSARPLHEALARAKRETKVSSPGPRDLDPHRRVDTSQYLLKRVKRVAVALEGLRARLERPSFSVETLRWRLEGPVGPLALAQRIAAEEPRAAAFLIAELALVLKRVNWSPLIATLGAKVVRAEVAKARAALKELAARYPTAPEVAAYVTQTLESAGV